MGTPSIKKHIISSLFNLLLIEGFEKNKLILVTATGLISGFPLVDSDADSESKELDNSLILAKIISKSIDLYQEEHGTDSVTDNDGFIMLKDVVILTPNGSKQNSPSLIVFYDQIIAASIGNLD